MIKKLGVCLFLLLSAGMGMVMAQTNKSYIRAGVGTGINYDAFNSCGLEVEWGKTFKGLHVSASLTLLSSIPLNNTIQAIFVETDGVDKWVSNTVDRNIAGKQNISLMLNAGYDLFRFIPGNKKHHLIPSFGLGWSSCTTLAIRPDSPIQNSGNGADISGTSMYYLHGSAFDFSAGARYEYAITEKLNLGLSYKYMGYADRDLLGIHVTRVF